VERRARPQAEEEDEDNTLSLAQMEETLKPAALEKFAEITSIYKKFSKVQAYHGSAPGRTGLPARRREEIPEAPRAAHRRGRERPVPQLEDRDPGRRALRLQPPPDRARGPDASPRRAPPRSPQGVPRKLHGPRARRELAEGRLRPRQEMGRLRRRGEGHGRAHPLRDRRHRPVDRHLAR